MEDSDIHMLASHKQSNVTMIVFSDIAQTWIDIQEESKGESQLLILEKFCDVRPLFPPILYEDNLKETQPLVMKLCEEIILSYTSIFSERISLKKFPTLTQSLYLLNFLKTYSLKGWRDYDVVYDYVQKKKIALFFLKIWKILCPKYGKIAIREVFLTLKKSTAPFEDIQILFERYFSYEYGLFVQKKHTQKYFIDSVILDVMSYILSKNKYTIKTPHSKHPWVFGKFKNIIKACAALRTVPELPLPLKPSKTDGSTALFLQTAEEYYQDKYLSEKNWFLSPEFLPKIYPFILTVRHDIDRHLSNKELDIILSTLKNLDIRSSWYFRRSTYDKDLAKKLLSQGHEIGYHADHGITGDFGFAQYLRKSYPEYVVGVTYHGGSDSSYWKGKESLQRVSQLGFMYAENLCDWFPLPYKDHESNLFLTSLPYKIESRPEWTFDHLDYIQKYRGHLIFENHPDLFFKSLPSLEALLLKNPMILTNKDCIQKRADFLSAQNEFYINSKDTIELHHKKAVCSFFFKYNFEKIDIKKIDSADTVEEIACHNNMKTLYITPQSGSLSIFLENIRT